MRIAILGTRGLPANYGGFETFADELSKRLVLRGHEVTVYSRRKESALWFTDLQLGRVKVRIVPAVFHKYLETIVHTFFSFLDCGGSENDVILLCNAANSPFIPLANIRGIPVVVNVDGVERKRAKWNSLGKLWYRLGELCSVVFASKIVADAEVIAAYYKRTYSADSEIIAYGAERIFQPAGVAHSCFNLIPKKYLLFVSRLEPENNALGVIQAYVKSGVSMPLVIVGDAPYADSYKAKLQQEAGKLSAESLVAGARIVFAGFQFGLTYRELREHCYLYIQATEVGGTHPALVEAMAHANCVVANDVAEHREVLSDAGVYYPFNDFERLSFILKQLAEDSALVTKLGNLAFERAKKHYSWESITDRYERLLLAFSGDN